MKVGINLLWLVPGVVGGSEDATVSLLQALADADPPDLDVTLFVLEPFTRAHPAISGRFATVRVGLTGRTKSLRIGAETAWLAAEVRRRGLDVIHHAGGVVPVGARLSGARVVLTVHDLQPLVLPEHFSIVKRTYLRTMLPRSVRAADVVLTPSEHARSTVAELVPGAAGRVRAVPLAIDPAPPVSAADRAAARARYGLPGPFFLYPAITYPHKNHRLLLEAFAPLVEQHPEAALVLTGGADSAEAEVTATIGRLGLADRVRRPGRIPRRDLETLFAEATALTFPSRYEGFGLPVAEAMVAGCPVIAADTTSLPEVVAGAGILVPPDRPKEWTRAMGHLLDDDTVRRDLADQGRRRAAMFEPARGAAALADAYREAAEGIERIERTES